MNKPSREDVLRVAKECGWEITCLPDAVIERHERFAAAMYAAGAEDMRERVAPIIEAAKYTIFCPDAGGYKGGRSVEDCYEELESAVNEYYGADIRASDLGWITEDELNAMLPITQTSQVVSGCDHLKPFDMTTNTEGEQG